MKGITTNMMSEFENSSMETRTIGSIIVNYETDTETQRLADQIREECVKTVIVDNSSPSTDLANWCSKTADVTYLASDGNIGYAAGNNLGIKYLSDSCDCYFIVNPDTKIPEVNTVNQLARKLMSDPDLGILAPAIDDEQPCNQHGDTASIQLLHQFNYLPPIKPRDDGLIPRTQVVGCSIMISADLIGDIGLLDPSFFLYVEEIEFCYRARENGYQVAYDPEITMLHNNDMGGFSHSEPYQVYYRVRNQFLLARRRFTGLTYLIFLLGTVVILYAIFRNGEWKLIKPWVEGMIDGILGREGKTRYLLK